VADEIEKDSVGEVLSADEQAYLDTKGGESGPVEKAPVEKPDDEHQAKSSADVSDDEAEDDEQPQADKEFKSRKVPHRALAEERKQRQELERQLAEVKTRTEERLNAIQQALQPKPEAPPPPPDKYQDPIGFIEYQEKQLQQVQQTQQQFVEQQRQQNEIAQIDNAYSQSWKQFAQEKPEAEGAYRHFVSGLDAYFKARGVTDQAQVNQLIAQEERQIALANLRTGKSPAEAIFNIASAQGYKPAPAQAEAPVKTADEEIERRQRALPASRSMSSSGGSGEVNGLSVTALLEMSDDEFAAATKGLSQRKREAIFGA